DPRWVSQLNVVKNVKFGKLGCLTKPENCERISGSGGILKSRAQTRRNSENSTGSPFSKVVLEGVKSCFALRSQGMVVPRRCVAPFAWSGSNHERYSRLSR